jgi:hypothetical protein
MRTRYRIALAVWLVAIVALIAWPLLSALREPVYRGKRLSVWLEQQGTNHFWARYSELDKQGQTAIRQIGTNALPMLLERLRARDTRFKQLLINHQCAYYALMAIDPEAAAKAGVK